MFRRLFVLLLALLSLVSCADEGMMGNPVPVREKAAGDEEEETDIISYMDDLLQFHVTAIDPALEGKGYWQHSEDYRTHKYYGYWVPYEGERSVAEDKVFVKERLEVGVPRIVPIGYVHGSKRFGIGSNIDLHIQFDGVVQVTKVEPADNSILLAFNLNDQWNGLTTIEKTAPAHLNILPVGKKLSFEGVGGPLIARAALAEKEYLIEVKAYELDGTLMITAQLKIITLPDEGFDSATYVENLWGYGEHYSYGEELTRLCSIELVSYEYSDMYRMMAE